MEVITNTQLPERANLEHLKGQAKALYQLIQSGDAAAISRLDGLPALPPYRLAHAQLALAREYGFASWAKLKRHLAGYGERRENFFSSIRAGDRDRVRQILAERPELIHAHDPGEFGSTPLTLAARRNDRSLIRLLIEHGADVNARSDWGPGGFSPLDYANDDISDYLLSQGATLTAHAAARLGRAAELRRIIAQNPAVVNERGGDGQFPLHFSKSPEIVDILIDSGAEVDARDIDHEGTALQYRILDEPVAKRLMQRGATPDVFSAAVLGDVALLAGLLDSDPGAISRRTNEAGNPWIPQPEGRPIYFYNIGPKQLHQVATDLKRDAVYDLLWERSSPALRLAMAGWRGDRKAAFAVLRENPGVAKGLSAAELQMLPAAAWERRIDTVRLLLEVGFDPDARNEERFTAVCNAAFHGFDDVVEAILPFDPDLTIKNCYGGTPIQTCIYGSLHGWRTDGSYAHAIELLIEAGSPMPEHVGGSAEVRAALESQKKLEWP